jgi:hypothetical protein
MSGKGLGAFANLKLQSGSTFKAQSPIESNYAKSARERVQSTHYNPDTVSSHSVEHDKKAKAYIVTRRDHVAATSTTMSTHPYGGDRSQADAKEHADMNARVGASTDQLYNRDDHGRFASK